MIVVIGARIDLVHLRWKRHPRQYSWLVKSAASCGVMRWGKSLFVGYIIVGTG